MSTLAHYATSLSDEQWYVLQPMLPESKWQPGGPGRPLSIFGALSMAFSMSLKPVVSGA